MSNLAKKTIISVALLFAFGTAAAAVSFSDDNNLAPPNTITSQHPYSFTHSILDDGYDPAANNHITSATLSLDIIGASKDARLRLTIGETNWEFAYEEIRNKISIDVMNQPLSQLDTSGTLAYTISALSGNFKFHGSTLEAIDPPAAAAIPEPATLALLATGLFGIGAVRRRQR